MNFEFKYGIVSEVKPGYAKVSFEENEIVTDWLPVLVRKSKSDKESWQLEIKEHVVCLMDPYCNEGVILGAIPNETDTPDPGEAAGKFRKKFSDGTVIEYDKGAHKLFVDVKGSLEAKTTGAAKIDAATQLDAKAGVKAIVTAPIIELTGNVVVSGTLSCGAITVTGGAGVSMTGDLSTTGDVLAGGKSLKTHVHTGVQTGPGVSGPPQ
jgi:phage baseplate assembly protein V